MKVFRNIIFTIAGVLLVLTLVVKFVVVPKTVKYATEQVVEEIGSANGLSAEEIKYINSKVDPQDQAVIEEIIENHMFDEDMINNAKELAVSGDKTALKELANENLTDDEKERVKAIYLKYKEQIESGELTE